MAAWAVRGLMMAVVHAAGALVLVKVKLAAVLPPTMLTWITIALLIGVALLWGSIDGWRRLDGAVITWLIAGVVGGLLGGVLNVAGRALFVDQTGVSQLPSQLTSGAAFTALLIMVPAWIGFAVGSRLEAPEAEQAAATEETRPRAGTTGRNDSAVRGGSARASRSIRSRSSAEARSPSSAETRSRSSAETRAQSSAEARSRRAPRRAAQRSGSSAGASADSTKGSSPQAHGSRSAAGIRPSGSRDRKPSPRPRRQGLEED
ncbi:hypothetical protein [Thermocrispum municipale]|uniref:hypothetical protein n=1 Tax=Thermocrispum municipale TaxID=37926 RepID=UPI001B7F7EC5|nr:hypothetical protein [Thermocrispum municipale]